MRLDIEQIGGSTMTDKGIQALIETVAASREVADRQIKALNAAVEKNSQDVKQSVDRIEQSATRIEQSVDRIEQSATRVEQQVGLMSEHLTALDNKLERLADKIDGLADRIAEHLTLAVKQSDNISDLTKLVTAQANTAATQANTVAMLISRAA